MAPARTLSRFLPVRILLTGVRWAPVWVPLILIWQLTTGGLKPALAEQRRLRAEEPAVLDRHARTHKEHERLAAQRRAWDDPLFHERVRREKERASRERGSPPQASAQDASPTPATKGSPR